MKNIFLALDLERFDERLLNYALEMSSRYQAKLYIVHVAPYPSSLSGLEDSPEFVRLSIAEELRGEHRFLNELATRVKEQGVEAVALLIKGEIVKSLLAQAESIKAELIITGINRHSFVSNTLGGNTALEILKRSKVPVLCYPL